MSSKSKFFIHAAVFTVAMCCGVFSETCVGQNSLIITTWNIETLGGGGRGFASGFGQGSLGLRTPKQLADIADLIKDELKSDIIAIQEVSITSLEDGEAVSAPLETITEKLGDEWNYFLPSAEFIPDGHENMFCAFLWNSKKVTALKIFPMDLPNPILAGSNIYRRTPIVGYFEAIKGNNGTNDFVLVNIHLKSGQDFDENHIIAITNLEHSIYSQLKLNEIKESDRIILGDFNDNPYAKTSSGNQKHSNALYKHMEFKGYQDLVTSDFHGTRMNLALNSIIDHILRNRSAKKNISQSKADIFLPFNGDESRYAEFRETYSDHFPVSFKYKIETKDDDVDF